MACKYIVINKADGPEVVIGNVEYHSGLLSKGETSKMVLGGGVWYWQRDTKKIYFYGSSLDFGSVSQEAFTKALKNSLLSPFFEDHTICFSNHVSLALVFEDAKNICVWHC